MNAALRALQRRVEQLELQAQHHGWGKMRLVTAVSSDGRHRMAHYVEDRQEGN